MLESGVESVIRVRRAWGWRSLRNFPKAVAVERWADDVLAGQARIGPVYKLPGGMVEQVRSVVPATWRGPACEEDVSIDR